MAILPASHAPIGIFDSGVGGLSVLRHIRAQLPHEHLLYFADSAFAPYGDKPEQVVTERVLAIGDFLVAQGAKAHRRRLQHRHRRRHRPAARALSRHADRRRRTWPETRRGRQPQSGLVGVLATERTLSGRKIPAAARPDQRRTGARFLLQPCHGLADQIEFGELDSEATTPCCAATSFPARGRRRHAGARLHPLPAGAGLDRTRDRAQARTQEVC
jgi:glutamate racemase